MTPPRFQPRQPRHHRGARHLQLARQLGGGGPGVGLQAGDEGTVQVVEGQVHGVFPI
jgi:hypothetical protein